MVHIVFKFERIHDVDTDGILLLEVLVNLYKVEQKLLVFLAHH